MKHFKLVNKQMNTIVEMSKQYLLSSVFLYFFTTGNFHYSVDAFI